jgi:hypothetical protein
VLQTIAELDRDQASAVLASAAQRLLRTVDPELARVGTSDLNLAERVIAELSAQIGPAKEDESEERHLGRLSDALSRALSETVLAGADLDAIRRRAGQRGALPADLYRIVFTNYFEGQAALFAIRKSYVEDAIKAADTAEHLKSKSEVTSGLYVSLFVKTPRIRGAPYSLLIKCNRTGAELHVEDALYFFHDTFQWRAPVTPVRMLLDFLAEFGRPLVLNGRQVPYLIKEIIEIPSTGVLDIRTADGTHGVSIKGPPGQQAEVFAMYSFNSVKYATYLQQHGISSRPVPGGGFAFTHSTMITPQ